MIPDMSKIPIISQIQEWLGLSPDSMVLANDPLTGAPGFIINETVVLNVGGPFAEPPRLNLLFSITTCQSSICVVMGARFMSRFSIDILEPSILPFAAWAQIKFILPDKYGKPRTSFPGDVSFKIGLQLGTQVEVKGFPFIKIGPIAGEVDFQIRPLGIRTATLQASAKILDTNVNISLFYTRDIFASGGGIVNTGVNPYSGFAFRFKLDSFDLERALRIMGLNVNLGPFNIRLWNIEVSRSSMTTTTPLIDPPIRAGLIMKGSFAFLGFEAMVDFQFLEMRGVVFQMMVKPVGPRAVQSSLWPYGADDGDSNACCC
jgi:hypothetical protein